MHGPELTVVVFVCLALAVGAFTRLGSRSLRLPYTVAVLLVGLGLGLALGQADGSHGLLARLEAGSEISADLIIFVFLPALIFESAFALDVHAFRKELAGVSILAVPALLASTAAVGALMYALGDWSWEWSLLAALVFGALISATDPVAVVAILRETPSPKRLGILIEGESLLNDGTAIVLFGALLALLAIPGAEVALGGRALDFLWVVGGGIGVGLALGVGVSAVLSRVYNDAMVEITLTIVIAYAAMAVAEAGLHVSGVMAIVSAGLWMAGPGRTRISPEVQHFLHQFWEMVSFLANTLIFFLVGLVVAAQWRHAELFDLVFITAAYFGVMAIRFAIVFAFRPLVGLVGDPISRSEATLMSWGGLRGAVSLALALIVSQRADLDAHFRQQILLLTTGVVVLTILVNGSTIALMLRRLGLTERGIGERIAGLTTKAALLSDVGRELRSSCDATELSLVPWDDVIAEIEKRAQTVERELGAARAALAERDEGVIGYWRGALGVERRAYWRLFARGLLQGREAQDLDREIARQLDRLEHGELDPPDDRTVEPRRWRALISRFGWFARAQFSRLASSYELSRAQSIAAEQVLASLATAGDDELVREIAATYRGYRQRGKERVEELRAALPEVAEAIETRLAQRIRLNMERAHYDELVERGAIDPHVAHDAVAEIERHIQGLQSAPTRVAIPETATIVVRLPLFRGLEASEVDELAAITEEVVFEPGAVLIDEGAVGDSMYVIARGAVHVTRQVDGDDELLDVLGGGEIVGEMSLLTERRRVASVRAATVVTAGKVNKADFLKVMAGQPGLRERIWQRFSEHRFDNACRVDPRFAGLGRDERMAWLRRGRLLGDLEEGAEVSAGDHGYIYLVAGEMAAGDERHQAPAVLEVATGVDYRAVSAARVITLPALVARAG